MTLQAFNLGFNHLICKVPYHFVFAVAEAGAGFDSKGFGLKAQKKLLSKMSTRKILKAFIDDTTSRVLDNLYRIAKDYKGKKEAEKIMKNIIKIVVKIGILYRNDQFDTHELTIAEQFKRRFRSLVLTIISFHEVDFTFDRSYLSGLINECSEILHKLIARHLTAKSQGRVDNVFSFFSDADFLEVMFSPDGKYKDTLKVIIKDLEKMMDDGIL